MIKATDSELIDISKISSQSLKDKEYLSVFPEFYKLASITEDNLWHDNQTGLDHVISVFYGLEEALELKGLDKFRKEFVNDYLSEMVGSKSRKEVLIVSTLLHDIGKSDTLVKHPDGTATCPLHELVSAARVKNFSQRFGLNGNDETYAERIVRYHGFISEILGLIISNRNYEKYYNIFQETVGDIVIELIFLTRADLLGSDLDKSDQDAFDKRLSILERMLNEYTTS